MTNKIWCIKSGGDWCDASATLLVENKPLDMDLLHDEHLHLMRKREKDDPYITFDEYLIKMGYAREPSVDQADEFWA